MDMPEGYKHFSKTKPMKLEHFDKVKAWWNDRQEIVIDEWPKAKKFTAAEIADNDFNLDLCVFPHEEEEILPPDELIASYQAKRTSHNKKIDNILATIETMLEEKG